MLVSLKSRLEGERYPAAVGQRRQRPVGDVHRTGGCRRIVSEVAVVAQLRTVLLVDVGGHAGAPVTRILVAPELDGGVSGYTLTPGHRCQEIDSGPDLEPCRREIDREAHVILRYPVDAGVGRVALEHCLVLGDLR